MPKLVRQAGVIPFRGGRVCLVTSRSGARWVIPKGHIDPGFTATEAAMTEAWEEAGLTGTPEPAPLGEYEYQKLDRDYTVTVYLLADVTAADDWPEAEERSREWFPAEEAARRVAEPGLKELILLAAARARVEA